MDRTPHHQTDIFTHASKNLSQLGDAGNSCSPDTAFCLNNPFVLSPSFFNTKGNKTKCSFIHGSKTGLLDSSLVLGLGFSASSSDSKVNSAICTAISSGKEFENESSTDVNLEFHLHLGNKKMADAKQCSEALQVKRHDLDLELSLSTGPANSDITSITLGSRNNAELSVIADTVQLVDEGSTSSKWKLRQLGPPLNIIQNLQSPITFNSVHDHGNLSPVGVPAIPKVPASTAEVSLPQQRKTSSKICKVMGCGKGARGASGHCISHGGGRRCQRAGCPKGAEGRTTFCKAHGGGRRCQHLGCTKSAEGRTDNCIAHGGGKRCSYDGCTRAARGKSGLCIRHGGGKRCQMENCTKSAEGLSGLCISHGGGRRCQRPECTKGAQGSTNFCKAHGGGKRCTAPGCTKGAEGSTAFCKGHGGGKRCSFGGGVCPKSVHGGTLFCVRHGGGKRCATPGCTKSARGKTSHCVRHGGGKRCKHERCEKSAQGSTDYCKAHGGGKRCTWGQLGLDFGGREISPCDKFARGKSGLCAVHSTQMQDKKVHGGITLGPRLHDLEATPSKKMKETILIQGCPADGLGTVNGQCNLSSWIASSLTGYGYQPNLFQIPFQEESLIGKDDRIQLSLPEGRVHGGSLMAMLSGNYSAGTSRTIK